MQKNKVQKEKQEEEELKNTLKNVRKSKKGITLIALVITIIVLLILAGVTISMLTGDNRNINKIARSESTKSRSNSR